MDYRIGIVTPAYKRYDLLKKYCIYMQKLVKKFKKNSIKLMPILISDDKKIKEISSNNHIKCLNYKNEPLSEKWNYGIYYFKEKKVDAIIILGSDNFISFDSIKVYKNTLLDEKIDVLGFRDIYYWHKEMSCGFYHRGYTIDRVGEPIGAGRMLKKSALDKMQWRPWNKEKNVGLDSCLNKRINNEKLRQHVVSLKQEKIWIADIKGAGESITKFSNIVNLSKNLSKIKKDYLSQYNDENFKKWIEAILS